MRVSELAEWREIPGEPGQRMLFRPLTGPQIREARRDALAAMADQMRAVSGVDLSGFRPEGGAVEVDEVEQRRAAHDPTTVVRHGLVEWTYDVPCDDEHKATELVAGTEQWAADCILEMSLRTEAEKKASTEPSSPGASPPSSVQPTSSGSPE